jgi:hypothetical protein
LVVKKHKIEEVNRIKGPNRILKNISSIEERLKEDKKTLVTYWHPNEELNLEEWISCVSEYLEELFLDLKIVSSELTFSKKNDYMIASK